MQQRTEGAFDLPAPAAGAAGGAIGSLGAVTPAKAGPTPDAEGGHPEALGKLAVPALSVARHRRRLAFKVAAVLSLLLHAGGLFAFLRWHSPETGAIEQPSEAISVEIVASRTLEALRPRQAAEPAPAPEVTAPAEGKAEASEAAAARSEPEPEPEQPRAIEPPRPVDVPEAPEDSSRFAKQDVAEKSQAPPPPVEGPAEVAPPPLPKAEVAEADAARRRPPPKRQEEKAREHAPKGGTVSKAREGKGRGGERASASSGSMLSYAAHVRARVAANSPSGASHRGTAVVSFGLTASGGLAYASVARSSGDAALDRLALAAVRGAAPFPAPPAGATAAQLRFTISFNVE